MKKKATPKTYLEIKNKIREVTHTYNNQPLLGNIMTEEERKKRAKAQKALELKFKSLTGVATQKDNNAIDRANVIEGLDLKFIAERTGAAVSEEELAMMKKMLKNR